MSSTKEGHENICFDDYFRYWLPAWLKLCLLTLHSNSEFVRTEVSGFFRSKGPSIPGDRI